MQPEWLPPDPGYARLLSLPEEDRDRLATCLRQHTIKEARKVLAEHGFNTAEKVLLRFLGSWTAEAQFEQLRAWEQRMAALLDVPPSPHGVAYDFGHRYLAARAVQEANPRAWAAVQRTRLQSQAMEFGAAEACQDRPNDLKAIRDQRGLEDDAKIQALRVAVWGPALDAPSQPQPSAPPTNEPAAVLPTPQDPPQPVPPDPGPTPSPASPQTATAPGPESLSPEAAAAEPTAPLITVETLQQMRERTRRAEIEAEVRRKAENAAAAEAHAARERARPRPRPFWIRPLNRPYRAAW